jgi:two-component system, response regulator
MSHSRTILLVEDNDDDLELTLRAFEKSGIVHDMVIARDGRQALDYLFGTGAFAGQLVNRPDVVLLDLNLPKLDGLDVLQQIRADTRTRYLPVVILTSSNSQQDVLRSYNLGANSFVRKPVDFARFLAAAHELGVYWLDLNVNATIPAAAPPA